MLREVVVATCRISMSLAVSVERNERLDDHVIIGTPGTVLDWMSKFRVIDPAHIKVFILDEADVMIAQQGHQDQSIRIHR